MGEGLSSSQTSQAANEAVTNFGGDTFNFGNNQVLPGQNTAAILSSIPKWCWIVALAVPGGLGALYLVTRYLRKRGK